MCIIKGGRLLFAEFTADRSINLFHLSAAGVRDVDDAEGRVLLKRRN